MHRTFTLYGFWHLPQYIPLAMASPAGDDPLAGVDAIVPPVTKARSKEYNMALGEINKRRAKDKLGHLKDLPVGHPLAASSSQSVPTASSSSQPTTAASSSSSSALLTTAVSTPPSTTAGSSTPPTGAVSARQQSAAAVAAPTKTREERSIDVFERLNDQIRQINQAVQRVKRNDPSLQSYSERVASVDQLKRQSNVLRKTVKKFKSLRGLPLSDNETAETLTHRRWSLIELNDQVQMLCHVVEHQVQIPRTAVKEPLRSFRLAFSDVSDQVQELRKAILNLQLSGETLGNRATESLSAKKTELYTLQEQIAVLEDKVRKLQKASPGPLDQSSRWEHPA
jgi:hypothetical protein